MVASLQPTITVRTTPEITEKNMSKVVKPQPQPKETKTNKPVKDKYPLDHDYLRNVGSHSMAKKYTQYLVLSPRGSDI